ncbi:ubiquitin-like protein [Piedraia hortae CBS 480.64]|uniref:Ubiquitin-like modifier HUB1 n=1 Tax=Piedraia hortae CBS 480.64 TaxID=1314780 RepID=A0A6A7CBK1_9PEZI|nr:ubiquitin-like protein [Piedraia hortae CBS 480.64]
METIERSRFRSDSRRKSQGLRWKMHDNYRERSRDRESHQKGSTVRGPDKRDRDRSRSHSPRPKPSASSKGFKYKYKTKSTEADQNQDKYGSRAMDSVSKPPKPKVQDKPAAAYKLSTGPAEPMIIVNVNDRLGTKAAIPCLASDSVKNFKALVAAQIGRAPHEILLKRQGERPFKDQLTLKDYGVSSGVQLDLELDTGD